MESCKGKDLCTWYKYKSHYNYYLKHNYTGFLKLPNECLDVTFSDEDSVEYLLPQPSGPGVFSYALVAHLVYAHNEFVDKCSEIVKRPSDYEWRNEHQWYGYTFIQ